MEEFKRGTIVPGLGSEKTPVYQLPEDTKFTAWLGHKTIILSEGWKQFALLEDGANYVYHERQRFQKEFVLEIYSVYHGQNTKIFKREEIDYHKDTVKVSLTIDIIRIYLDE